MYKCVLSVHSHGLPFLPIYLSSSFSHFLFLSPSIYKFKKKNRSASYVWTDTNNENRCVTTRTCQSWECTVMRVERQKVIRLMHRLIVESVHYSMFNILLISNSIRFLSAHIGKKQWMTAIITTEQQLDPVASYYIILAYGTIYHLD